MPVDLIDGLSTGADRSVFLLTTDEDGRFFVPDANPRIRYSAIAAGYDVASAKIHPNLAPGSLSLMLEVSPAYGVRVVLKATTSAAQENLRVFAPPMVNAIQGVPAGAQDLLEPTFIPVLGGWDSTMRYGSGLETTALYVADREVDSLGELRFKAPYLVFQPIDEVVSLERIRGHIPEVVIEPKNFTDASAICKFNFNSPAGVVANRVRPTEGNGHLEIHKLNDERHSASIPYFVPVTCDLDGSLDVALPLGEYTIRYRNIGTGVYFPRAKGQTMALAVSRDCAAEIDLKGCGGLRITVRSSDGCEVSGGLYLTLQRDERGRGRGVGETYTSIPRAPYELAPITPGRMKIRIRGHGEFGTQSLESMIEVRAAEWTSVEFTLPDK